METNQDYVSYDLALALKKAGFDEPCRCCYVVDKDSESNIDFEEFGSAVKWNSAIVGGYKYYCKHISAPTLWQAQKWLREKCGIHIDVCIYSDYSTDADGEVCDKWDFWGFDLYVVVGGEKLTDDDGEYDSYETALSAGIAAALELITK